MEGSVANLDGSAFHLIGAPRSSDQSSQQHKRKCSGRGEDGSVKCGSSGRCHCSKKRFTAFLLIIFSQFQFNVCVWSVFLHYNWLVTILIGSIEWRGPSRCLLSATSLLISLPMIILGGSMDKSQSRALPTLGIFNFSFLSYGDIASAAQKGCFCFFFPPFCCMLLWIFHRNLLSTYCYMVGPVCSNF